MGENLSPGAADQSLAVHVSWQWPLGCRQMLSPPLWGTSCGRWGWGFLYSPEEETTCGDTRQFSLFPKFLNLKSWAGLATHCGFERRLEGKPLRVGQHHKGQLVRGTGEWNGRCTVPFRAVSGTCGLLGAA